MSTDAQILSALVGEVRATVGERPVLVLGSRALGTATPRSDLDAYVVVPSWRVPWEMQRLHSAGRVLEQTLGVPVSLNPLPAALLRRTGGAMLPFKLRREAIVAWGPGDWSLGLAGPPPADTAARRSYAMSGLLFLLQAGGPVLAGDVELGSAAARLTAKAVLHAVQLDLAVGGRWAPTLPAAAAAAGGGWPALAAATGSPATWLAAREQLMRAACAHWERRFEAIARSVQWAMLRGLRGRPTLPPLRRPSPTDALTRAACDLTGAIAPGHLDLDRVASARAALPRAVRRGAPRDWDGLCRLVEDEWANASPLGGL